MKNVFQLINFFFYRFGRSWKTTNWDTSRKYTLDWQLRRMYVNSKCTLLRHEKRCYKFDSNNCEYYHIEKINIHFGFVVDAMCCYEFLSRIASSALRVNCYQRGSCIEGPSALNSPFGHGSHSHNIRPLDNHLSEFFLLLIILMISIYFIYFTAFNNLGCLCS